MNHIEYFEKQKESLSSLNLTSDFFVSVVLKDKSTLQELLFLLTGQHFDLETILPQYSIRQLLTHSVTLDIYAETKNGTLIHLEIQNSDKDDHLRRNRYCRACIDTSLLERGTEYVQLPNLLQIFITKNDFTKSGEAIIENKKPLFDGTTELYFNLKAKHSHSEPITKLQQYFLDTTPDNESSLFPHLVNRVNFLKHSKKGRVIMCEVIDAMIKELVEMDVAEIIAGEKAEALAAGRAEGLATGRAEGLATGRADYICRALETLGTVPISLSEKIRREQNEDCLNQWFHFALASQSIDEFKAMANV